MSNDEPKVADAIPHCTGADLFEIFGPIPEPTIAALNDYLKAFAFGNQCPKCGAQLGGLLGSFQWGLVYGEGYCNGGLLNSSCGWPCRGIHDVKRSDGSSMFTAPLPYILAYHPSVVVIAGE